MAPVPTQGQAGAQAVGSMSRELGCVCRQHREALQRPSQQVQAPCDLASRVERTYGRDACPGVEERHSGGAPQTSH